VNFDRSIQLVFNISKPVYVALSLQFGLISWILFLCAFPESTEEKDTDKDAMMNR